MQKTILLVEDFEDSRNFMKFLLEKFGYLVLEAEDGFKAVEIARRQTPDLILMDMALPLINGLTATKMIKQFSETAKVPIIAMTASGEFIYRQAMEAGCQGLITKPIDIDKLQPLIESYLSE